MLAKAKFTCPNCSEPIQEPLEECLACGLHLDRLDGMTGTIPRHDSFVTDYQEAMSRGASRRLSLFLFQLGKQFPQATFSVFFFPPPLSVPHRLYAFWLANRGRFSPLTAQREHNFSSLLFVDCDRGRAVLTVGYGLEQSISAKELEQCLAAGRSAFNQGNYARGVRKCFTELARRLRRIALADPVQPADLAQPENPSGDTF